MNICKVIHTQAPIRLLSVSRHAEFISASPFRDSETSSGHVARVQGDAQRKVKNDGKAKQMPNGHLFVVIIFCPA